jgi:hypothetical protein
MFLQQQQHQGKWSCVPSAAGASDQVAACSFCNSRIRASGRMFLQQQEHQTKWSPVPSAAAA